MPPKPKVSLDDINAEYAFKEARYRASVDAMIKEHAVIEEEITAVSKLNASLETRQEVEAMRLSHELREIEQEELQLKEKLEDLMNRKLRTVRDAAESSHHIADLAWEAVEIQDEFDALEQRLSTANRRMSLAELTENDQLRRRLQLSIAHHVKDFERVATVRQRLASVRDRTATVCTPSRLITLILDDQLDQTDKCHIAQVTRSLRLLRFETDSVAYSDLIRGLMERQSEHPALYSAKRLVCEHILLEHRLVRAGPDGSPWLRATVVSGHFVGQMDAASGPHVWSSLRLRLTLAGSTFEMTFSEIFTLWRRSSRYCASSAGRYAFLVIDAKFPTGQGGTSFLASTDGGSRKAADGRVTDGSLWRYSSRHSPILRELVRACEVDLRVCQDNAAIQAACDGLRAAVQRVPTLLGVATNAGVIRCALQDADNTQLRSTVSLFASDVPPLVSTSQHTSLPILTAEERTSTMVKGHLSMDLADFESNSEKEHCSVLQRRLNKVLLRAGGIHNGGLTVQRGRSLVMSVLLEWPVQVQITLPVRAAVDPVREALLPYASAPGTDELLMLVDLETDVDARCVFKKLLKAEAVVAKLLPRSGMELCRDVFPSESNTDSEALQLLMGLISPPSTDDDADTQQPEEVRSLSCLSATVQFKASFSTTVNKATASWLFSRCFFAAEDGSGAPLAEAVPRAQVMSVDVELPENLGVTDLSCFPPSQLDNMFSPPKKGGEYSVVLTWLIPFACAGNDALAAWQQADRFSITYRTRSVICTCLQLSKEVPSSRLEGSKSESFAPILQRFTSVVAAHAYGSSPIVVAINVRTGHSFGTWSGMPTNTEVAKLAQQALDDA